MSRLAGIPFEDALTMATSTPARILGLDDRKGTIEEGKDADLVVINNDLSVSLTMVGGEVVFE